MTASVPQPKSSSTIKYLVIRPIVYIVAWILVLSASVTAYGGDLVRIQDSTDRYIIWGSMLDIYEDPSNRLTIKEVSLPSFQSRFKSPLTEIPANIHRSSTYWIRFSVKDESFG